MEVKTLEQALSYARLYLKERNIEEYELDGWYLFSHYFHINRATYLLNKLESLDEQNFTQFMELVKKRGAHVPLQYVTGEQEFMGLPFIVSKDVLIPRQDTEILVEEVLKISRGKEVLDVCTGSGCIILSLSRLGHIKRGVGVDISPHALRIANQNKENLGEKVTFLLSDLFENVEGMFDIIVSNPPYIRTKDIGTLMEEVRDYEPHLALDGKEDGLYFYNKIAEELPMYLKAGGSIFFEIGHDQGKDVSDILARKGFVDIVVIKDLAGLDRIVKAVKEI